MVFLANENRGLGSENVHSLDRREKPYRGFLGALLKRGAFIGVSIEEALIVVTTRLR